MNKEEAVNYLRSMGYGIIHPSQHHIDLEKNFINIWNKVSEYTHDFCRTGLFNF